MDTKQVDEFFLRGYNKWARLAGHCLIQYKLADRGKAYWFGEAMYYAELAIRCDEWYAENKNYYLNKDM